MKNSCFHQILENHFSGRNLSELARELDMPRSILQDWVQSKRSPSMKNLKYLSRIADYLELTLDELLVSGKEKRKVLTSISFSEEGRTYNIIINRVK